MTLSVGRRRLRYSWGKAKESTKMARKRRISSGVVSGQCRRHRTPAQCRDAIGRISLRRLTSTAMPNPTPMALRMNSGHHTDITVDWLVLYIRHIHVLYGPDTGYFIEIPPKTVPGFPFGSQSAGASILPSFIEVKVFPWQAFWHPFWRFQGRRRRWLVETACRRCSLP